MRSDPLTGLWHSSVSGGSCVVGGRVLATTVQCCTVVQWIVQQYIASRSTALLLRLNQYFLFLFLPELGNWVFLACFLSLSILKFGRRRARARQMPCARARPGQNSRIIRGNIQVFCNLDSKFPNHDDKRNIYIYILYWLMYRKVVSPSPLDGRDTPL